MEICFLIPCFSVLQTEPASGPEQKGGGPPIFAVVCCLCSWLRATSHLEPEEQDKTNSSILDCYEILMYRRMCLQLYCCR